MKALQTKNLHQPVWEGGIYKNKVSSRTEHACYLTYACCLILPVVERDGGESQVNRGVLERQSRSRPAPTVSDRPTSGDEIALAFKARANSRLKRAREKKFFPLLSGILKAMHSMVAEVL
jgi:hypothetical protein